MHLQSPRQALRAAAALQQACAAVVRDDAATPLRVGVGIDVGEAVVVEGGHRGGALNLAARLCSIARAGEVLVSESVVHLAGRVDEIDYRHRGRAALKGFREPVRYYQAWFPLDLPPEPTQTRRTSHSWWTVAAVASLVAVGSLATLVVYKRSGGIDSSLPPNAVANVDTKSGKPLSLTQFRGSPTSLAVGMGYTWAATRPVRGSPGFKPTGTDWSL